MCLNRMFNTEIHWKEWRTGALETDYTIKDRKELFRTLSFSDKIQISYPIFLPQILRNKTYIREVQWNNGTQISYKCNNLILVGFFFWLVGSFFSFFFNLYPAIWLCSVSFLHCHTGNFIFFLGIVFFHGLLQATFCHSHHYSIAHILPSHIW